MGTIALVVLAILIFLVVGYLVTRTDGGPLYSDEGRHSKTFVDPVRRIRAKPDRLEGTRSKATLAEFKQRPNGRLYESDRAQTLGSVLAVRASGIRVVAAEVQTGGGRTHKIRLAASGDKIERQIAGPLGAARLVANGGVPSATPSVPKCTSCSFRKRCPHAAS